MDGFRRVLNAGRKLQIGLIPSKRQRYFFRFGIRCHAVLGLGNAFQNKQAEFGRRNPENNRRRKGIPSVRFRATIVKLLNGSQLTGRKPKRAPTVLSEEGPQGLIGFIKLENQDAASVLGLPAPAVNAIRGGGN